MATTFRSRARRICAVTVLTAVAITGCGRFDRDGSVDIGPVAGATLAVVGVQYDATLHLRTEPGNDQPVAASLGSLEHNLSATGKTREVDSSQWFEVKADGVKGWADSRSLAYLGTTEDVTRRIVDKLGRTPTAVSMLELGRIVTTADASTQPPVSRITVTVAPTTAGGVGEVTYDVVGFADDSVLGERLHVLGKPGEKFTLIRVIATPFCRRGVAGNNPRLCV